LIVASRMIYLDSSIALRTILDVAERTRLQAWMRLPESTFVSSRLLRTEVIRTLRRDGRDLSEGAPLLDRVGLLDITRETQSIAESIQDHIKTLDAVHLATALLLGDPVIVASHDATMKSVAASLGLRVEDPI